MEKRTDAGKAAKLEYIKQYNKEKYEYYKLTLQRGEKARIRQNASKRNKSINQYIIDSIDYYEQNN